ASFHLLLLRGFLSTLFAFWLIGGLFCFRFGRIHRSLFLSGVGFLHLALALGRFGLRRLFSRRGRFFLRILGFVLSQRKRSRRQHEAHSRYQMFHGPLPEVNAPAPCRSELKRATVEGDDVGGV